MVDITCPICKHETSKLLFQVNNEEATKHFIVADKKNQKFSHLKKHLADLWDSETCQVLQCQNCQFCYANPYIAGDEKFYDLTYAKNLYPQERFEFTETINVLTQILKNELIKSEFQLLEIGAGDGAFLKQLITILNPDLISATEYSESGIQEMNRIGVHTYKGDFREVGQQWSNQFSAVCLFQVLEHLDDLERTFETLNAITKKQAHLFIAVPNMERINFNEINGALLDMPPHHIGRYNKNIFNIIADRFGWILQDHRLETESFAEFQNQFVYHRYQRNAQIGNNLDFFIASNKLLRNRFSPILKLRLFYLRLISRKLIRENYQKIGGTSQWVYLVKK